MRSQKNESLAIICGSCLSMNTISDIRQHQNELHYFNLVTSLLNSNTQVNNCSPCLLVEAGDCASFGTLLLLLFENIKQYSLCFKLCKGTSKFNKLSPTIQKNNTYPINSHENIYVYIYTHYYQCSLKTHMSAICKTIISIWLHIF